MVKDHFTPSQTWFITQAQNHNIKSPTLDGLPKPNSGPLYPPFKNAYWNGLSKEYTL